MKKDIGWIFLLSICPWGGPSCHPSVHGWEPAPSLEYLLSLSECLQTPTLSSPLSQKGPRVGRGVLVKSRSVREEIYET